MPVLVFMLCAVLTGCAEISSLACPGGLTHAKTAELLFGRNTGSSETVSDADWQNFAEAEIAPRFPDGFTVGDASGMWRGSDGKLIRERTKRLFIVLTGAYRETEKLAAIRLAYEKRFHQESVLLFEGEGCVSF